MGNTGTQDKTAGSSATGILEFVDPTANTGVWAGAGMTEAGGTAWNLIRALANTAAFNAAAVYAASMALPMGMPGGTWDGVGQWVFPASIPLMWGSEVDGTQIRYRTGRGWCGGHQPSPTTGVPYVPVTADGLSSGLYLGNNTGNYSGPGGWLHDITIEAADAVNGVTLCGVTTPTRGSTTITAATNVGTVITATVASAAGLANGMPIALAGASGGAWSTINGTWTLTSIVGTTATFSVLTAPTGVYGASSSTLYAAIGANTDPVTTPSNMPAIVVNGVTQMHFERVRVHGFGAQWDFVNNCGGSTFYNCTGDYGFNNCGINLRTTGESGSDFEMINTWIHGSIVGISIEGGTDYHFKGGQLAANQGHVGYASAQDFVAPWWGDRNFIDGTIGSDGVPGTIPAPGTGSVGIVDFDGVDFEGTQFGWASGRCYGPGSVTLFPTCNTIAYPTASNGSGAAGCIGVFRMSSAANSTVRIGGQIKGSYQSNQLVQITGQTAGFQLIDDETRGQQLTSIAGVTPSGGAAGDTLPGNWTKIDPTQATTTQTNLIKFSGLAVPYKANHGEVEWFGTGTGTDLAQRTDGAGSLQISTDGVNWTSLVGSTSLPFTVFDYASTAALPNTPTYLAGVLTAGANTNLHIDGCTGGLPLGSTVLVVGQATASQNGTYKVTSGGSGAAPWVLTRTAPIGTEGAVLPTFQPSPGVGLGGPMAFQVRNGQANGSAMFYLALAGQTVGATALNFAQVLSSATPPPAQVSTPANPAATASTVNPGVMAGLGVLYTPTGSGSLVITISGGGLTNTAVVNFRVTGYWGTGGAPANGAAVVGTQFAQGVQTFRASAFAAGSNTAFSTTAKATGLTIGTPIWIDLAFSTLNAADTAQLSGIVVEVQEVT
jgi:hypothetical protein